MDLSTGRGTVPLLHPELVGSADCGALRCDLTDGVLVVRGTSSLINVVELKLRLRPHVVLQTGDASDTQPSVKLAVVHCPMTIVSGAPVRGNDEAKVVVDLEGACAREAAALRFVTDHSPLRVLQLVTERDVAHVLLRLGNIGDDSISITAYRGQADVIALAVAKVNTRPAPSLRAAIELPGFPNLGFIPNNRSAVVHVSRGGEHEHFELLPVEGVYSVGRSGDKTTLRGDPNAAGLTSLVFGLRSDTLPAALSNTDLAVLQDPLQRSLHEANIPAPIGASAIERRPLIEMSCGDSSHPQPIEPGVTAHLPFSLRDSCRIAFHRERLSPEYGTQKLNFEIDVLRSDGSARGESHVAEVVTFRAGNEPRYAWIHGVMDPFDRVVVRVSHEADEAHYVGASEIRTGAPAIKWSAVLGRGRLRLYGTTTIPTGLYRLSDRQHSGTLSLNFGIISRLTWLDADGHEGFLGLEGGILVLGLANSSTPSGSAKQVGAVAGIGISVPIANRSAPTQASIDLHAWFESNVFSDTDAGRYAFIFGPSISIGNVGLNL